MLLRALAPALLLFAIVGGCAAPPHGPIPTPTISVHEVFPSTVAGLLPQSVFNCTSDRETERLERLSPRERANQESQIATSGVPVQLMVTRHAQALSCWALHASDDQYVAFMQEVRGNVLVLPSLQLCIEEEMGRVEGMFATSMYIREGGDRSLFSDSALQCFPEKAGVGTQLAINACVLDRLEKHSSVANRAVDIPELWTTAIVLSCWAVHASDEDYQRFRDERGHKEPMKVRPSWQLCLEDAIGYDVAVEHLYSVLATPRGSVEFPEVWSQCILP